MKRALLIFGITLCAVTLARGDDKTRSLQQTLKDQGFYYGRVTGEKNSETTTAIRRFQIRNGLEVTGELNEETLRSVNSTSNSAAVAVRSAAKAARAERDSFRPEASANLDQSFQPAPARQLNPLQYNPPYATSFYQSAPIRMNRRVIAGAQYQLMSRGYYGGRVDGRYGHQMALALRAFQSNAGLPATGRLNMETLDALRSSDTPSAYSAADPGGYEAWMPVKKFKNGKWKMKWKREYRAFGGEDSDEDRQVNSKSEGDPYIHE